MAKKARYPQRLNWQDYLTFMQVDVLPWLLLQVGQPDYMASLVVGLDVKVAAYRDALNLYVAKNSLAPEQRKLLALKFTALREGLLRAKISLPVFFADPAVLGEFGLSVDITNDEDDMFLVAKNCLAHWDLVKLLPEYADLVPDFSALQTVFDDYNATRTLYTQTFQEAQIAQNDMVAARDVCNEHERNFSTGIAVAIAMWRVNGGPGRRGARLAAKVAGPGRLGMTSRLRRLLKPHIRLTESRRVARNIPARRGSIFVSHGRQKARLRRRCRRKIT